MQEESAERTVAAELIRRTFDARTLGSEVAVVDIGPESVEVYFPAQIAEVRVRVHVAIRLFGFVLLGTDTRACQISELTPVGDWKKI